MGYGIHLHKPWNSKKGVLETCVSTDKRQYGSTQLVGGTNYCDMSLTFNYAKYYYKLFPENMGLKWINYRKAKDTINVLEVIVNALGTRRDKDYWKPTKGNAGYAISILHKWAIENPKGEWFISS